MTTGDQDLQATNSGKRRHPGKSKKRGRRVPKGRLVSDAALKEIQSLLGERPRAQEHLIEYLHLIQDKYKFLSASHLVALAREMRLSLAEVYEVATFYAHFDVRKDQPKILPSLTLRMCGGVACQMRGAQELLRTFSSSLAGDVRVVSAPCMGRCDTAPVVQVGKAHVDNATVEKIKQTVSTGKTTPDIPPFISYEQYTEEGGYGFLRDFLSGARNIEVLLEELEKSGLRGLGGAGFPTARKWGLVRAQPAPRFVVMNADEGEPGTFKDRYYLERDPHRVLEGLLIAVWAVGAETAYIYLRDEYPAIHEILALEIDKLARAGLAPKGGIHVRRGAGAYICGEESAMLESLEGKRGLPRHRPPYAAEMGLFGRPTLINNVETLYWVRDILDKGADWFAGQGLNGGKGLRAYSVSGRVRSPGVKIAPAGITVRHLIADHCGGMEDGHVFKAYLPGGASGGILPARLDDLPLDYGVLEEHGGLIGSAAVVVLSDQDNVAEIALGLMRFFSDESCGQCTPCRVGTAKAAFLMDQEMWDVVLLEELITVMRDASICGLGQAAPAPLDCALKYFPQDLVVKGSPQ